MNRIMAVPACFLLSLTIFASSAFAALPPQGAAYLSSVSLQLTPTYQRVPLGGIANWTNTWSGEPYFNQLFTIHFGDGNVGSYKCWSNCVNGSNIFGYNGYPYYGLWGAWVTDQNFNGSNLADVDVY